MNRDMVILINKKWKKYFLIAASTIAAYKLYTRLSSMDRKFDSIENINTESLIKNTTKENDETIADRNA